MDLGANGQYVVSTGNDKTLRLWEKTEELVVIEEQKELVCFMEERLRWMSHDQKKQFQEREREYEQDVVEQEDVVGVAPTELVRTYAES